MCSADAKVSKTVLQERHSWVTDKKRCVTSHLSPGCDYSQGTHSTDSNSNRSVWLWLKESCSIKSSNSRADGFKFSCCHYCVARYLTSLSSLLHWRTNTYWVLTTCLASGALTVRWNCRSHTSQIRSGFGNLHTLPLLICEVWLRQFHLTVKAPEARHVVSTQ